MIKMNGQLPKDQVGAWQLTSVFFFRQCSADIYPLTFEERCTAVLFGAVLVMAVYAPDCHEDLDVYETFLKNVTRVLWEERRALANDFCITVTSMWSWGHNVQMKTTVKSSMTCGRCAGKDATTIHEDSRNRCRKG